MVMLGGKTKLDNQLLSSTSFANDRGPFLPDLALLFGGNYPVPFRTGTSPQASEFRYRMTWTTLLHRRLAKRDLNSRDTGTLQLGMLIHMNRKCPSENM
jgi:hypothetical protein